MLCIVSIQAVVENDLVRLPSGVHLLIPAFEGNTTLQEQFLAEVGVEWPSPLILQDTMSAHRLWFSHIEKKRRGSESKRPIADVFISAFAQRFQGLITLSGLPAVRETGAKEKAYQLLDEPCLLGRTHTLLPPQESFRSEVTEKKRLFGRLGNCISYPSLRRCPAREPQQAPH
jgi:hypothetical protein